MMIRHSMLLVELAVLTAGCYPAIDVADSGIELHCSSNTFWQHGDDGSDYMNPGRACISCHTERQKDEAPQNIGGTVYPSAHEPDLCDGLSGVTVELTGADGGVLQLTTNQAGNFFVRDPLLVPRPYRAKVIFQGRERVMATPQTSGDCNSCHTATGLSGAPGRIFAP